MARAELPGCLHPVHHQPADQSQVEVGTHKLCGVRGVTSAEQQPGLKHEVEPSSGRGQDVPLTGRVLSQPSEGLAPDTVFKLMLKEWAVEPCKNSPGVRLAHVPSSLSSSASKFDSMALGES